MNKIFFTITGTCYRYGHEFIEPGMTVRITKEPDNEFDKESPRSLTMSLIRKLSK